MDFSSTNILVDGSFHSPFIWVVLLGTTHVLAGCAVGLAWVLTRLRSVLFIRLALGACAAVMVVYVSPDLFERTAQALASIGAPGRVRLCLMPTNLFWRDYSPGFIAILAAAITWRRLFSRSASLALM